MTEIDGSDLIPSDRMREGALEGDVTQIHRGNAHADEGDTFTIDGAEFEIVEVTERTMGDLTDEDARAEGMPDLDAYEEMLNRVHDHFEWNDDSEVVRHRFERR